MSYFKIIWVDEKVKNQETKEYFDQLESLGVWNL